MAEYIEREAAIDAIMKVYVRTAGYKARERVFEAKEAVHRLPVADVAPVVQGRWIHSRYENCCDQFELVKCSQCGHEAYAMAFYVRGGNYCPNCGARMDGGADDAKES